MELIWDVIKFLTPFVLGLLIFLFNMLRLEAKTNNDARAAEIKELERKLDEQRAALNSHIVHVAMNFATKETLSTIMKELRDDMKEAREDLREVKNHIFKNGSKY